MFSLTLLSLTLALFAFQANAATTHVISVAKDEQGNYVWAAESNQDIQINTGDTILREWSGSQHNLVFKDGATYSYPSGADSNSLNVCPPLNDPGAFCSFSHTFQSKALIKYTCPFHAPIMAGYISVCAGTDCPSLSSGSNVGVMSAAFAALFALFSLFFF